VARARLYVMPSMRVPEGEAVDPAGTVIRIPCLRCFVNLRVAGRPRIIDCLLDTAAPLTVFPRKVWQGDAKDKWEGFADAIEWLNPAATPGWLTSPAGATGHTFRCRIGRVSAETLDYEGGVLAPVPILGQFVEDDSALTQILIGLHGGILDGRRFVLESDLRKAWLEDR
jgi:hypothetical protein